MNSWKVATLGSIAKYSNKRICSDNLNKNNYISTENMLQNKGGITESSVVPKGNVIQYRRGQTLISNIRPYFKKIWLAEHDGGCSADVLVLESNDEIDNKYFYYYLSQDSFFDYVMAGSRGTKMPRGDKEHIMSFKFCYPSIKEQKVISRILSLLDDKIANNSKINHNLEMIAQSIFKSWFVDFEPFDGKIPDDWQEVLLDELCITVTKGTTPTTLKKHFVEHGINFIKAESILDDHSIDFGKLAFIDDETNALLRRSVIQPSDIIFTIAGTLGRFSFVHEDLIPANTNQAVAIIRADTSKISPVTLYSYFVGGLHSDFYTKNIQQAVQANLSLTTIKALPLSLPSEKILDEYTAHIEPLFERIFQNCSESRRLAELRNILLPRLMSGELSVVELSEDA